MRFCLITSCWVGLVPFFAMAENPIAYRSNSILLEADSIILCSDFDQINAFRVTRFLDSLDQHATNVKVLDGPEMAIKPNKFNVLAVISGRKTREATLQCASETHPSGAEILQEVVDAVRELDQKAEHTNATLNTAIGDPYLTTSTLYNEAENWVTTVIAIREPSVYHLDDAMLALFDLPYIACEHNSACFAQ